MTIDDDAAGTPELQELRHRYRNTLQIINSLVGLHARGIADPVALDAFSNLRSRLSILSTIFVELDEVGEDRVDLGVFLPRIAHKAANLQSGDAHCPVQLHVAAAHLDKVRAGVLSQILAEMLIDAFQRWGSAGRPIEVRLTNGAAGRLVLTVGVDGGAGSGPQGVAQKLSQAIINSMATTLAARFQAPEGPAWFARLEFARDAE